MSVDQQSRVSVRNRAVQVLRDWRLLVVLFAIGLTLVIAITSIAFSGAYFTAQSPHQVQFATGTLRMQLSRNGTQLSPGSQIVTPNTGFEPGSSAHGEVTVTLTHGRGQLTLSARNFSGDGNPALRQILQVTVTQTGALCAQAQNTCAKLPVASLPDHEQLSQLADAKLGNFWAPDQGPSDTPESRTYKIEISWPDADADTANQGKSISFNFAWHMESS